MGFTESSLFLKACLFLLPITAVLQITGIASTNWAYVEKEHTYLNTGLWKCCGKASCEEDLVGVPFYGVSKALKNDGVSKALKKECNAELCHKIPSRFARDWVQSARTFGIIGGLAVVASVILLFLCVFAFNLEGRRIIFNIIVILTFVGGGAILLSGITFGANYKTVKNMGPVGSILRGEYINLGWSYGLCWLASILSILAGGLLLADFRKMSASRSETGRNTL